MRSLRIARLAFAASLLGGMGVAGCQTSGGPTGPLTTEEKTLEDLRITLEERDGDHVVVVTTPSGGWRVEQDDSYATDGKVEIFLTAFKPRGMYSQVLTPHRIQTDLDATKPIDVNLRVLERTVAEPTGPYKPVAFVADDEG